MVLKDEQIRVLLQAIWSYSYPKVTCNFTSWLPITHPTMHDLEVTIRNQLISGEEGMVKDGLCNVLYWGHFRAGYCVYRVREFRQKVARSALKKAVELLPRIEGDGIQKLRALGLWGFSNLSFISKLRMFLDPREYVTLDMSLMKISGLGLHFKKYPTYIPINTPNIDAYIAWALLCHRIATQFKSGDRVRAVDIERGFFHLVDQGNLELAAGIYDAAEG